MTSATTEQTVGKQLQFTFTWNGIAFTCIGEQGEGQCILHIIADMCSLPYTAENAKLRARLLFITSTPIEEKEGESHGFRMGPGLSVQYVARHILPEPELHFKMLVREAAVAVLCAKPYFMWMLNAMIGNIPKISARELLNA